MNNCYIHSLQTYLPGPRIDNETYAKFLGVDKDWIDFFIGNEGRYFSFDLKRKQPVTNLRKNLSTLVDAILQNSQININDISAIVLATATPDNLMPATVNLLASDKGFHEVETYQIQSGCSGAIQSMKVAVSLLNSGHKNILVLGGDCCNKFFVEDASKLSNKEIINFLLFGDGVGGFILSQDSLSAQFQIKSISHSFIGKDLESAQTLDWYGSQSSRQFPAQENYKLIETEVPKLTDIYLKKLLQQHQLKYLETDFFLLPQLSTNLTKKLRKQLSIDEAKSIEPIKFSSNIGNAMPFVQLEELKKSHKKGNISALIAIESSKWLVGTMLLESKGV